MGETTQFASGLVGFLAGLARASQGLRDKRQQENLALLQVLGRDPSREVTVASAEERQPTNPFQRLLGAGQFQTASGSPVVDIGGTPVVARPFGTDAVSDITATLTPDEQQDRIIQALLASRQNPQDIRLKVAQRREQLTQVREKKRIADEGLELRKRADMRAQRTEARQQRAETRLQGKVTKQDLTLIASGTPRPGVNITASQAQAALALQQTDGTDLQFNERGQLMRVTVGGKAVPAPVDKVTIRQQHDRLDAIQEARGLSQQLLSLASPENVGLLGSVRGTIQDLIKTGGAVGGLGTSLFQSAQQAVSRDTQAGLVAEDVGTLFDPTIPAIDFLENTLAYAVARSNERQGRLNREDVLNAKRSLGIEGILSNPARIQASLRQLGITLNMREQIVRQRLNIPRITFGQRDKQLIEEGVTDKNERLRRIIEDRDRGIVKPWPTGQPAK